jgi:hypothetical protein
MMGYYVKNGFLIVVAYVVHVAIIIIILYYLRVENI